MGVQFASEGLIKHMTERFLSWKLPDGFAPDGGISFDHRYRHAHGPSGTNLLTYEQAEAMVRHLVQLD